METWRILGATIILLIMMVVSYFVSGLAVFDGSIFERKKTVGKK